MTDDSKWSEAAATPPMPPLMRGSRRGVMALLVATALAHSACAVGAGLLVGVLIGDVGQPTSEITADLGVLVLALVGLAATRYVDRVVAERLGQDYVQQLRRGLVAHAMTSPSAPSLGITIARSTNDLASVRNWVSLGIAPLVALVPLAFGCIAALAVLGWHLAVVVALPLVLLAIVLAVISGPAFERARDLRRRRGSLAARVADTVTAATGIAAAGGVERELRALDRSGAKVVDAAVHRARTAGMLRAVALVAPVAGSA
ncbi:MAG: ABC transporter transmembrane domain-containing protein, partial [Janibacter sp.]